MLSLSSSSSSSSRGQRQAQIILQKLLLQPRQTSTTRNAKTMTTNTNNAFSSSFYKQLQQRQQQSRCFCTFLVNNSNNDRYNYDNSSSSIGRRRRNSSVIGGNIIRLPSSSSSSSPSTTLLSTIHVQKRHWTSSDDKPAKKDAVDHLPNNRGVGRGSGRVGDRRGSSNGNFGGGDRGGGGYGHRRGGNDEDRGDQQGRHNKSGRGRHGSGGSFIIARIDEYDRGGRSVGGRGWERDDGGQGRYDRRRDGGGGYVTRRDGDRGGRSDNGNGGRGPHGGGYVARRDDYRGTGRRSDGGRGRGRGGQLGYGSGGQQRDHGRGRGGRRRSIDDWNERSGGDKLRNQGGKGLGVDGGYRSREEGRRGRRLFDDIIDTREVVDDDERPKIEKKDIKSITVESNKGSSGGSKYCYGCGATIVKKGEQQESATSSSGRGGNAGGGEINMGLKASKGGYWNEKNQEMKISKMKNWGLCLRCRKLKSSHNNNLEDVGDELLQSLSPSHEMTNIFRECVSKIRTKPNAVVVLCVDAVNPQGSLIGTLRKYVGGNPILLAVTRCDLLPGYVSDNWSPDMESRIKDYFQKQAAHLYPAGVYLCSVGDKGFDDSSSDNEIFTGTQQLAEDLWNDLDGRDPYIVGAANIGKSTLTDRLIDHFISRAMDSGEIEDYGRRKGNLSEKERKRLRYGTKPGSYKDYRRFETIKESRVTKSSLPGTTLQNIRVPCFLDFNQALWDTPGLLLDPSVTHFPIRNFKRIKALRPNQIQPQWHEVKRKSFVFQIYESEVVDTHEDPYPLIRIEVRLKKGRRNDDNEYRPVHLVWNSTLNILSTKVTSIEQAQKAEQRRIKSQEGGTNEDSKEVQQVYATPEERAAAKEQRRREHEERIKAEKQDMGIKKWEERQQEQRLQFARIRLLSKLKTIGQEQIPAGKAMEINIPHFGSLGILSPRDALIRVFAPSDGIRPTYDPIMAIPPQWEDDVSVVQQPSSASLVADGNNNGLEDDGYEDYEQEDWVWNGGDFGGFGYDDDGFDYLDTLDNNIVDGHHPTDQYNYHTSFKKKDQRWSVEYSGEKVGWKFHDYPFVTRGKVVVGWWPIAKSEENGIR